MRVPELREFVPVPNEVKQAAELGDLIVFVGSGVSIRMGLPSWNDFAKLVLDDLVDKKILNHMEVQSLKALHPRKVLSIAKIYDGDLDWTKYFKPKDNSESDIYKSLNSIGCTFVTTNYDLNLHPSPPHSSPDGDSIEKQGKRFVTREELLPHALDEIGNVVHLHGSAGESKSMIVTTKEYLQHYDCKYVQAFLKHLFKKKTVLFVGYGLEEAELLEHILRRGSIKTGTLQPRLFSLQGFYSTEKPLYSSLHTYYKQSFDLELLGFLKDYEGYVSLDEIVRNWANTIDVKSTALIQDVDAFDEVLDP